MSIGPWSAELWAGPPPAQIVAVCYPFYTSGAVKRSANVTAAAGIVKKKLKPYDGTTIPLMAFSLGDLSLRNLKIDLKRDLHVTAEFGSAA